MNDLKMLTLDYPLSEGAIGSGIATIDSLRGGPPSTDLTEVFPEARSVDSFRRAP